MLEINNFSDQIEINKIIEHLNYQVSLGEKISPTGKFLSFNQIVKCKITMLIIIFSPPAYL